jgi:hypothetical protein
MNTPADVYTWRYVIHALMEKGNEVKILARDYGCTLEVLDKYGFEYSSFRPIRSKYVKFFEILTHVREGYKLSRKFNPTIIVGFGVDAAFTAALLRKPCLVFTDDDILHVENFLIKVFAKIILTPSCFREDLGKKQVRFAGYKELAYLHPYYFQPDTSIYKELNISKDERYAILRFNVFDAAHDIGKHGFSLSDKYQLVKKLEKYAHVFISAEGSLPQDLEGYKLPIQPHRIHHALYYAQLFVSDTQTMTTEAAILGTPAVRCNSFVGPNDSGNFVELEHKYNLIYCFREPKQAIEKALELVQQPDLKDEWARRRQILLAHKIDTAKLMIDFIEGFAVKTVKK